MAGKYVSGVFNLQFPSLSPSLFPWKKKKKKKGPSVLWEYPMEESLLAATFGVVCQFSLSSVFLVRFSFGFPATECASIRRHLIFDVTAIDSSILRVTKWWEAGILSSFVSYKENLLCTLFDYPEIQFMWKNYNDYSFLSLIYQNNVLIP